MRCPNCQTPLPPGATTCPDCGTVLDPNAGGANLPPPPQSYAETGYEYDAPYEAPEGPWAVEGTDPGYTHQRSSEAWDSQAQPNGAPVEEPVPHNATRVLSSDPERDKHTRVVQAPPPPKVPPRMVRESKQEDPDPILSKEFEAAVSGLNNVYKRLKKPEKVAMWSMVAAFVACFSPWYYIKGQGLVSGIEANSWLPALLIGSSLILLYLRFSLRWGILSSLFQLLLIGGATFAAFYFTLVPIHESIKFGLPATALAASVSSLFSIIGMLART